jgi:hypothetical protein
LHARRRTVKWRRRDVDFLEGEKTMLSFWGKGPKFRDGVGRRDFLRLGALGVGGLTLPDLLRVQAQSDSPKPKSIIYIVLNGGPSHIDMYDLKPDAPVEYRGPFRPIATRLTGVRICELMPRQAEMMNEIALLRGIRSVENDHFLSEVYSGLPRSAGRRPSFGSVAARVLGSGSALPPYVSVSRAEPGGVDWEGPAYAGPGYAPFRPFGDGLADLAPVRSLEGLQERRRILAAFDSMSRSLDRNDQAIGMDRFQAQALDIITSPKVRDAFDLSREPARVREAYGKGQVPHQTVKSILYGWNGDNFLRARRLVEAGVRVVTISFDGWDHHSSPSGDIFFALQCMLPLLDKAVSALLSDLKVRGLEEDVLVVMLGEFGRTPQIGQVGPGREHWAEAGCALLWGGGLRMGQVVGETDSRAERARSGSITFQNIFATIYQTLGIPLDTQFRDFSGRPQYLLEDREPIRELIG